MVAISAVLALAGCSMPSGVDGNLVNDWSAVSAPSATTPLVGECYLSSAQNLLVNSAVACTDTHEIEVAYAGTFAGSTRRG